jgi:hypothetical protein
VSICRLPLDASTTQTLRQVAHCIAMVVCKEPMPAVTPAAVRRLAIDLALWRKTTQGEDRAAIETLLNWLDETSRLLDGARLATKQTAQDRQKIETQLTKLVHQWPRCVAPFAHHLWDRPAPLAGGVVVRTLGRRPPGTLNTPR